MNKKVLTLCAGFLLAGGMLSTANAINIKSIAGNGKYYKIVRTWERGSDSGDKYGWATASNTVYLGETSMDGEPTLWKVVKGEGDKVTLVNLKGETFKLVDGDNTISEFTIDYNPEALSKGSDDPDFNQFTFGEGGILAQAASEEDGVWKLVAADNDELDFSEAKPQAFDAQATNLQEVEGVDASDFFTKTESGETYVADGKTYRIVSAEDNGITVMLKATYNKDRDVWSFTKNSDGSDFEFDGEVDFELIQAGDDAILKLKSGKGYVKFDGTEGEFVLVNSIEDATILAFAATNTRVPVSLDVLNYYEKDGFSIEINGYDTKDKPTVSLAGDPFVGHLTPMSLVKDKDGNYVFEKVDEDNYKSAYEYYLKNEDGKYIVAVQYKLIGNQESQALYKFTTVEESALLHNIARAYNHELDENQIYFGRFRASVDEAALEQNPKALEEITWLQVNIAQYRDVAFDEYATLGRADDDDVPTLLAAYTDMWGYEYFDLMPIHISLQAGNLVDWKEFLLPKFYTIEKIASTDEDAELGKLTARYNSVAWTSNYGNALEGQWALTVDEEEGKYVFKNRETLNSVWDEISINGMYTTDKANTYKFSGETYVIKPVAEVSDADGYKRFSDSELNRQYHVAFSSNVFDGRAYLIENHEDAEDPQAHVIGLETERDNALVFNVKKYNAARDLNDEQDDHTYLYHPSDSIYVISTLGYYDTKAKEQAYVQDTLKVVAYSFVNQFTEPLMYGKVDGVEKNCYYSDVYANDEKETKYASVADAHKVAQKFTVRYDNNSTSIYNLRPVELCKAAFSETQYVNGTKDDTDLYQEFAYHTTSATDNAPADIHNDWNKVYAGDATLGILDNVDLYDRTENDLFVIEETESEVYRRLVNNVDTVSIYRNSNEKALLYEKTTAINDTTSVNFLGLENIADFTDMAPAMIADTAYVRNNTYKPQYMLVVDPTIHPTGKWCEEHQSATCEHAVPTPAWTEGRFLVNLVDSAKAWDNAHKHQVGNPYVNEEGYYKLGFVQATHRNDTLTIASDSSKIFVGDNNDNIAKFQFRYVDQTEGSFVIETKDGYLKWMNGVVVVVPTMTYADIYNVNEDESRTPTANEEISAENAAVSVVATDGAVIIKGAEGKNVVIATILGKVVANETVNSDNETIAVPAGIAVVSVDGESFKVVVK